MGVLILKITAIVLPFLFLYWANQPSADALARRSAVAYLYIYIVAEGG